MHLTIRYLDCFSTICVSEPIQLSLIAARLRLLSSEVNARPLIYLRALLLNEPFVITVDTPVRITIELLLLPRQWSSAFPWKYLF
jgi:hypothetical protein